MIFLKKLELAIVSDEISNDFREAVRYGKSWGIRKYELRQLISGRIPQIDLSELDEIQQCMQDEHIEITALSPGIFKLPLSENLEIEHQLQVLLPHTINAAKKLSASMIIIFGFQKTNHDAVNDFQKLVDYMKRAAEIARMNDMQLVIENEPGYWCDSGTNTANILERLNSKFIHANWDPANAFGCNEVPYPDGYNALKNWIANVHVKDTRVGALIESVPIGEGLIDWRGQLRSLVKDNLVDHITIETHCLPLIEKSKQNVETMDRLLDEIYKK